MNSTSFPINSFIFVFSEASGSAMFGVPRFLAATLTCASGVWNSSVMVPPTTGSSLGSLVRMSTSLNETGVVPRSSGDIFFKVPQAFPSFRIWKGMEL